MTSSQRAPLAGVLVLCVATAMALPSFPSEVLAAILALLIILLSVGWPALLGLPSKLGSSAIIAFTGLAALGLVYLRLATSGITRLLIIVVAMAVFLSFVHEMFRKSRRNLTLSISGTASGALLAIISVTWLQAWALATAHGPLALALLITMTLSLASSVLCLALPTTGKVRIPLALGVAVVLAIALSSALHFTLPLTILAGVGTVVLATSSLSIFFLLERVIGAYDPQPFLAMATAPIALGGILCVLFVRIGVSYFPSALGLVVFPAA